MNYAVFKEAPVEKPQNSLLGKAKDLIGKLISKILRIGGNQEEIKEQTQIQTDIEKVDNQLESIKLPTV